MFLNLGMPLERLRHAEYQQQEEEEKQDCKDKNQRIGFPAAAAFQHGHIYDIARAVNKTYSMEIFLTLLSQSLLSFLRADTS